MYSRGNWNEATKLILVIVLFPRTLQYLATDESWTVFITELTQACGTVISIPVRKLIDKTYHACLLCSVLCAYSRMHATLRTCSSHTKINMHTPTNSKVHFGPVCWPLFQQKHVRVHWPPISYARSKFNCFCSIPSATEDPSEIPEQPPRKLTIFKLAFACSSSCFQYLFGFSMKQ